MHTEETKFECPACGAKLKKDVDVTAEIESIDDENVFYDGVSLQCPFCSTTVNMPEKMYYKR